MWILFEDAEESDTSVTLRKVYERTSINICFTGGSGCIVEKVVNLCGDDKVIIYIDLVPDNPETAKTYKNVRKRLRHRSNTYIVPVICTEYYFCAVLVQCLLYEKYYLTSIIHVM